MAGGLAWITQLKLKNKLINEQVMKKFYTVIMANSYEEAREKMVERWGTKWAFQYSEEDWVLSPNDPNFRTKCSMYGINPNINRPITQAEMYGLREIK